jgi:hypothetical protein
VFSAIRWGAAALVLGTFSAGAAQASIITNPGFETGDFTGWALSGDLSFTAVDDFSPHSGRFSAGLGTSGSTGSISQTLATTAGVSYDIEFWVNTAVTPNFFSVSFDGIVLDALTDITTSSTILPPFYRSFSYTALASSASTDLVFTFRHDAWIWDLDDVSVDAATAVPEPGSLSLFAGGLTMLIALRRHTRHSGRVQQLRPAGVDRTPPFTTPSSSG